MKYKKTFDRIFTKTESAETNQMVFQLNLNLNLTYVTFENGYKYQTILQQFFIDQRYNWNSHI